MTDTIKTHSARMLSGNLHPSRIVLLEEYGGRILHMTLDEAEAFEKSSGYVLEDILPDFMFGEVLGYLRHKGAMRSQDLARESGADLPIQNKNQVE